MSVFGAGIEVGFTTIIVAIAVKRFIFGDVDAAMGATDHICARGLLLYRLLWLGFSEHAVNHAV